jgi:uncharacterized protein with HEPN domain
MAVEKIKNYTSPYSNAQEFVQSEKTVDAVERNFEKMSEALKNAYRQQPDLNISNIQAIISFRNLISHVYYEVNYDIVWKTILVDLPVLEKEVRRILDDFEKKLESKEL